MTGLVHPEVYRQSLLRAFTVCPRRTMHGMKIDGELALGWVEHYGDLGKALHEVAAEILRTLYRQGEQQMPTQEAIEVMYEVLKRLPFTLPFEALDELRWLVLGFCAIKWNPKRILALEEELRSDVVCSDGVTRVLKGQPDILLADPPDGLVVVDLKSGRGRPKGPRVEPEAGEVVEGRQYLSDLFQGDTYSLLALRRYPAAQRVTFRELHLRSGQVRQGTLGRDELEHVERKLEAVMMDLVRAVDEGEGSELWRPRPGGHCNRQCPVALSCPIPQEMRGDGAIRTPEEANAAAEAWAVLEGQRSALRSQLKAWDEDPTHPPAEANESEVVTWNPPLGKGRKFGLVKRADVVVSSEEQAA
jgi:hypothetical protein